MRGIEGWLEDEEADLLLAVTVYALRTLPKPHVVVEVGSYCGRSTVVIGSVAKSVSPEAKVYAIDPHDGKVGSLDRGLYTVPPTLERFKQNMAAADLTDIVEVIQKCSYEVTWDVPISLLFIDGLHDYANVARDFSQFERWIVPGGLIAFHDYSAYYPGVQTFVNEILSAGKYRQVRCEKSMMVVQKFSGDEAPV
jgi:predicted O-methyltransferase YrrM